MNEIPSDKEIIGVLCETLGCHPHELLTVIRSIATTAMSSAAIVIAFNPSLADITPPRIGAIGVPQRGPDDIMLLVQQLLRAAQILVDQARTFSATKRDVSIKPEGSEDQHQ